MVSYRTLIFGTIAVISAAAPAMAAPPHAMPGPQSASVRTMPPGGPKVAPPHAMPGPQSNAVTQMVKIVLGNIGQWERQILNVRL